MGLFTKDRTCVDGKAGTHVNIVETDEKIVDKFHPTCHDDEYIYGRREIQYKTKCTECGETFNPLTIPRKEFEKIKKTKINEADLEEVEVSTELLRYKK